MKRLFLCILVMLTAVLSYAQSEQAEFKGGIGMSSLTGSNSDGFGETVSWKAGFGFDFPIWGNLYVQPSLMVVSKGFKGYALTTTSLTMTSKDYHAYYVQIPAMLAYRFYFTDNIKLVLAAGPYFAYGISGTNQIFETVEDGGTIGAKRLDLGAGAEAKVELGDFVVGADVTRGFTKVFENSKTYNFTYGLILGYQF